MRIAAIILNVLLIVGIGFIIADDGLPSPDEEFFLVFLLFIITPIFTVATLFMPKSESWLTLYFRRKAAEERKRIAEIEGNQNSQQPPA